MKKALDIFKKYGPLMKQQDYSVGNAILVIKNEEGIFSTKAGVDFENINETDIEKGRFNYIPGSGENFAMVLSQTPSCQIWIERKMSFKPSLDDMAQIIGPVCKYYEEIPSKLGINAGCFVGKYNMTLTVGRSLYEAIVAMTVLEKSASVSLLAEKIGGEKAIGAFETRLMRFVYKKKYSKAEEKVKTKEQQEGASLVVSEIYSSFDEHELHLRESLVEYGKLLVSTGLVQGTWGNLSVRLNEQYMLVTPSGLDYTRLTPADMVKVNIESLEWQGNIKPTSEKGLHGEIYKRRPDVGSIIHTHAKYSCVYAAAEKDFSDDVKLAGYGLAGTKALKTHTADALGNSYGAIMSHHGMIACGSDLSEAFGNCQKIEEDCKDALK